VKRQANEFRAQFDAAMREAELDAVKKEFETMQASVNAEVLGAKEALAEAALPPPPPVPLTNDALALAPAGPVKVFEPPLPMPPMPATPSMER
jgi:sec-independent protein translocase protein TatB